MLTTTPPPPPPPTRTQWRRHRKNKWLHYKILLSFNMHFSTMPYNSKTSKEILDKKIIYKLLFFLATIYGLVLFVSFFFAVAFETESLYLFAVFWELHSTLLFFLLIFSFYCFIILPPSPPHFKWLRCNFTKKEDKKPSCRFFPLALFSQQW